MAECRYIVRFDDICPTMNWRMWEAIEAQLELHQVKPILAVIPDNQDPGLMIDPPAPDFWGRVRDWQRRGYSIAMHGYQHVYINNDPGMIGLTPHSEFTGLSYPEQEHKIRKGLAIFAEQGVRVDAWVAPSHSFDQTTLAVLLAHGVSVVSDGLWPWPHLAENKVFWVPQQLWGFRDKPAGIWTVCQHPNSWGASQLAVFTRDLAGRAAHMTDLATTVATYGGRPLTIKDQASAMMDLMWNHRIRGGAWQVRRWLQRTSPQP